MPCDTSTTFDRLLDDAIPAILDGDHDRDAPPADGGRWGATVLALPPWPVRARLASLAHTARHEAGEGHLATGSADAVHATIRALEPHRARRAATDSVVGAWRTVLDRVGRDTAPFDLLVTGVTMSRGGVMAQLEPDAGATACATRLRDELGDLGWFEEQWGARDIWYATLVHFASDIRDPPGLVRWVREHRTITPVLWRVDVLDLVRFAHSTVEAPARMLPIPLHTVPLRGGRH